MGAVLGHHAGDHPLGGALGEERLGDLLDHPPLRALAHPDQHGAVADRHHVAALHRCQPEVRGLEATVGTLGRVPELELGVGEHRVGLVDGGDVVRLAAPGRPVHRVDRHPAVDPARRVACEQRVGQRRQHEGARVVEGGADQRHLGGLGDVESGLGNGEPTDQVLGELIRLEVGEQATDLLDERPANRVLGRDELDQPLATLVARRQGLGEQLRQQEHLDAALAHTGDELVVLVLRPLDPQHVVEQQLIMIRRRQPLEAEVRAVDHHLAQLADLGMHTELAHGAPLPCGGSDVADGWCANERSAPC